MADSSVPITAGAGTNIDTRTTAGTGDHRQVVTLGDPSTDANVATVNANGALLVQGPQSAATALSVTTSSSSTGTLSCTGYNVATVTITGTYAGINLTFEASTDGGATWVPINGAQLDAGVVTAGGATGVITSNASRGWDIAIGAADSFRVRSTAFTSGAGAVRVAFQTLPYEPAPVAQLAAGTNIVGALVANQSANVAQINAVTPLMGNGITGTGSQRVTIASDNTAFSVNAATTPAQPTTSAVNSAATTNATAVKGSAGTVYALTACNTGAAAAYVKLYNKATAPTVGTDVPWMTFTIPAGSTQTFPIGGTQGVRFTTGIALAITNLMADTDTTAVVASQVKAITTFI